jgi:hypothetical protein
LLRKAPPPGYNPPARDGKDYTEMPMEMTVPEDRSDFIARIKQQVRDKTYRVRSVELAEKIAQKLREDESLKLFGKFRK